MTSSRILTLSFILDLSLISSVRINHLAVPEVVKQGQSAILDCDYSVDGQKDDGLVVKWFFNENPYPVYQWIPYGKPQELGVLKGRLNLDYVAASGPFSQHRALLITRVGVELSGNYTCSVSTFVDEDSRTKSLLVFAPGKEMELRIFYAQDENARHRVVCEVDEVFPRPTMRISINESEAKNATLTVAARRDGFFDVELVAELPELPDGTRFACELYIPRANYTVKKEVVAYGLDSVPRASSWRTSALPCWSLMTVLSRLIL
ncbi:uncharacterized protein LOC132702846 [Cylas formicarius]|uniref:uncharacterized protein LOC132702846 n=1 Tax=Cylas formicarius TaxID=197179 RepID=UPI0029588C76|nr:uncharacterized protein LOC132702846 [Cylas formicarius]